MTKNQIDYWNFRENQRNHLVTEKETQRTNKANERIKQQTNSNTLQIGLGNLAETNRSNLAREAENYRTNTENENIKRRANLISEWNYNVAQQNADTNRYNADTNRINAGINAGNLEEMRRTNLANESIREQQNAETHRTNIENENIKRFSNATNAARTQTQSTVDQTSINEQSRHNRVVENETKRNNLINQQLQSAGLLQTINRDEMNAKISLLQNMKPNISTRVGGLNYGN